MSLNTIHESHEIDSASPMEPVLEMEFLNNLWGLGTE